MSTLQTIRNKAGLLVAIVIGAALVAFILGDMFRSGNKFFGENQLEIAEINGESIEYPDFHKQVERIGDIYKSNSGTTQLDEETWVQVREQTWQEFVRKFVMEDVYDDLGIAVSSEELYDLVQGNNIHPIVQQIFRNPNTGQIDRGAIVNFLKNLETGVSLDQRAYWLYLEQQILKDRTLTKYNNLVKQGLYATSEEAQNSLNNQNRQVNFDYIALNLSSISDSQVVVTEKDLKNYYALHKNDYKQEKTRRIEFVSFPVIASDDDNIHAKEWIDNIVADYAEAQNNVTFVNSNSDVNFTEVWSKQEDLPENIANWVYTEKADTNAIYGPYFEDESYKIAKLHKMAMMPDSVEVRHILLSAATAEELTAKQQLADSLKTLIDNGASFAALAAQYSSDQSNSQEGGDLGWVARNQMVKPFEESTFNTKVGEVDVITTQFGVHIVQPTKRSKETKQVQVAYLIRKVEPSDETYQKTFAAASKFAVDNTNYEKFNLAVAEQNLTKKSAELRENDRTIVGLENPRQLIRAAFSADQGDVLTDNQESSIFELGDNYVIAALVNVTEEGNAPLEKVKARVELAVIKEKKAKLLADKIKTAISEDADFAVVAQSVSAEIKQVEGINFNSFFIPEIGLEPAIIGTVTDMQEGQISQPVIGNNAVYLLKVTSISEGIETDLVAEQERLTQVLGSRASYQAFEAQKTAGEIVDKRSKFY